jgi:hypothetical protein
LYAQALAEDPNAFDYDGVYDSMQQQKAAPRHQERVDRRPKYIAALVEQAQVRKKEQDIAFERKLVRPFPMCFGLCKHLFFSNWPFWTNLFAYSLCSSRVLHPVQ